MLSTKVFEGLAVELPTIIIYDGMEKSIPLDD